MANTYDKGDKVKIKGTFSDADGNLLDPTEVFVRYCIGVEGTAVTKQYVTDPEVVRESLGVFYMLVDADTTGDWYYAVYSTGTGKASDETFFRVIAGPASP